MNILTLCDEVGDNIAMAQLPVPMALDIHDVIAADNWRKCFNAWTNYALATELDTKPQPVQVATLLTVIGEDSREVYSTFRTQNSLFRSVRPGDSTLRLIGVAIMRVTFCDIHYSLLTQFT